MTSTIKVNGMVTAQNIQKFEDTVTELVLEEEEKSNMDMLNMDCGSGQIGLCNTVSGSDKEEMYAPPPT
jgi:hypothetical protein